MLTEAQVTEQCNLLKKMLEVSSYFDGVTITVQENNDRVTIFDIATSHFVEVRYDPGGIHAYLPGYYNECGGFGSEPPSIEEVYLSNGKTCRSFHQACVKIVSRLYEDELQIAFERDEPKSHADYKIFDQTG